MSVVEAIRLALAQIRVQKLKSFFTLLGVTIGVMFLIAVVSIVQGMSNYVENDFAGKFLGVNTGTLRQFPDFQAGNVTEAQWRAWQRRPKITVEDADAVRDALPPGARWAVDDMRWINVTSKYTNGGPQVLGHASTPQIFTIKDLKVVQGRAFSDEEETLGLPVAVIGQEVQKFYFPNVDPVGRELRVGGLPFRVIGVLDKQGTVFGLPLDRVVYAPLSSPMQRYTGARIALAGVTVQAVNESQMDEVTESVREVMRKRHKLRPEQEDDFAIETSTSALSAWQTIKRFLTFAGLALPTIGLVVGAIVIMNIMLVAVAERTREIGIRKSLGARRRDIMAQFLAEAATLSTLGALVGIGLGFGLSALIKNVTPLPSSVAAWSIGVSIVLGAGVGILAGVYPAHRASKLDPIVALRAE
ncbi:MAG TPA: ABC transporter permease [Gemmatimonadaceae bacterium]|nr:ABC transporter permease [Gemmatimonadaceae bacterium]